MEILLIQIYTMKKYRSLSNHTHNINSITNLQNELNNRSVLNQTHPNISDQTDITRIMNSQPTASFILEGYLKYLVNGTLKGARLLILPVDRSVTVNVNIINTNLQTELNNWAFITHSHTYGMKDIVNFQNDLNKYSLTNQTHTDLSNQTDIARIIDLQQTATFVLEGDWTVRAGGEIEGGRMLIIPVDRIQSTSGYLEFKIKLFLKR